MDDDFKPSYEFEKKLEAATSAPDADPQFVNQLRAQIMAAAKANQVSQPENTPFSLAAWMKTFWSSPANLSTSQGNSLMRTRLMVPALMAALVVGIAALFAFNTFSSVSAQQILERASSAQSAAQAARGILHNVVEVYDNPQALPGDRPGTTTFSESYYDTSIIQRDSAPAAISGLYRYVDTDASGKILEAGSVDGSFDYSTYSNDPAATPVAGAALTIYRSPLSQDDRQKAQAVAATDSSPSANSLFEDFRSNPRVELEGKITWTDGSQAYVLVNHNEQTQKLANGQVETTQLGSTKMIFSASTYELLESQTSIRKDGQDIVISEAIFTVSEVLPSGSPIAWDLSDLKGAVFVDDAAPSAETFEPKTETISEHELAARINAYVLKSIPAGLTLKILATPNDPKGETYNYEINYYNDAGDCIFGLMAVGTMNPGFIESSFYDGSYVTASGLVINYSPSSKTDSTNGMLTIQDGTSFLLSASMSRAEAEKLAETLVPAK